MVNSMKRHAMKSSTDKFKLDLPHCSKLREQGELQLALKCVSKLVNFVKNNDVDLVNALILKAVIYRDLSRPHDTIKVLDKALKIATDKSLFREESEIHRQKSYLFVELGKSSDAEALAFKSLTIARKFSLKREEANAGACIGHVFEDKGDFQRALSWYQEGLSICNETDFMKRKATLLGDIGKVYGIIGHLPESFLFLKRALEVSVKIKYEKAIISSLYRLGDSYRSIEDKEKAKDFYNQALEKAMNMGFKREQGDSLYRLGLLAISNQNPEEAIAFLSRALNIFEEINFLRQNLYCLLAIGHALEQQSETLKALEKYLEAFRRLPNILEYTDAYIQIVDNIANSYQMLGHADEPKELSNLVNELREYAATSGVFDDFRKHEKIREVTSKIKKIIDRIQNIRENTYFIKGLFIDFNKKAIKKDDKEVRLTKGQWEILDCLWKKKGQVCTRHELRLAIGIGPEIATRTIDEQIHKIRKELGYEHVLSKRGEGYNLRMID